MGSQEIKQPKTNTNTQATVEMLVTGKGLKVISKSVNLKVKTR